VALFHDDDDDDNDKQITMVVTVPQNSTVCRETTTFDTVLWKLIFVT
jgi:hypothetical protein